MARIERSIDTRLICFSKLEANGCKYVKHESANNANIRYREYVRNYNIAASDHTTHKLQLLDDGLPPAVCASSEVHVSIDTAKHACSSLRTPAVSQILVWSEAAGTVARLETVLAAGDWDTVYWCFDVLHGKSGIQIREMGVDGS